MSKPDLETRLATIRLAAFDVDGVFTDGKFQLRSDGTDEVRFDTRDGLGVRALIASGIRVVLISGRRSEAVARRARDLGIDRHLGGVSDKAEALRRIRVELDADLEQTCFVGDDLQDLAAFAEAGLTIAVADAAPEVWDRADLVLLRPGGDGAVREVAERLLTARGLWKQTVARFARGNA
jgi:YrbI family 3-deoxy-D-manno-octulosonate 8-phosphate phosphatase